MKTQKQRIFSILAILTMAVILTCVFIACDKTGAQDPNSNDNNSTIPYIRFIVDDAEYSKVQTKGNEIIVMPTNPQKDGYTFVGWFWDKDTWQRPFTANSMLNEPMNSDMKVYAHFEKQHQHTFAKEWAHNNTYHWHASTCGHDIVSDKAAHSFDANRVCTICGYQDTELHGVEIKTNTLSVDGTNISGKVSNATTIFSFIDEISVADSATYTVSTDINGSHTIKTKTVNLAIGDNTYYIFVENGKDIRLYTVSIRRRPIYTVTFDSNGGTEVEQQQVEEDSFATEPNTTRIGYDFDKWNYDLTKPILKDETITANWSAVRYSITYVLNGGENNPDNPFTYTVEDEITLLAPIKVGYTGSWSNNGKIEKGSTGNKTFTASYTINQYNMKVTPSIKNVCSISDGGVYDYNTQVTINLTEVCLGYDFLGWYNGDTLLSSEYSYSFSIPAGDLEITAKISVKEEMMPYEFTSTTDTCQITGVKNKSITKAIVPDYVTSIGESAFSGCNSLTSMTLPFVGASKTANYGYNEVFGYIFGYITSNSSSYSGRATQYERHWRDQLGYMKYEYYHYNIPSSIESVTITGGEIGGAFVNCAYLTSITIPDSVTYIGTDAFSGCAKLARIEVSESNVGYSSVGGVLYDKEKTIIVYVPQGISGTVNIPDSVTSIEACAFSDRKKLYNITIPDSVKSIGASAFSGCTWLHGLTIPNGVTSIAYAVFRGCLQLSSIQIPESVTSIGDYAFSGCSIRSITIPKNVIDIGKHAFDDSWLRRIAVSDDNPMYSSKDGILYNKEKTVFALIPPHISGTINIPDTITCIGKSEFEKCIYLEGIIIPDSVTSIGEDAFGDCTRLTSVIIGNGVKSIGARAFSSCTKLENITIPDSVTNIGVSAFSNCSVLAEVAIGNGVTNIDSYTFKECIRLTSVIIPNSVTSIDSYAFLRCTGLTELTVGSGVTIIDRNAFTDCNKLAIVNWNAKECRDASSDTFKSSPNITTVNIGNDVVSIPSYIFYNCSNLNNVTLGNSVVSIGECAFLECTGLTNIIIPNSVTDIGNGAFRECSGLTDVTIGNSVTSIGINAFRICIGLTSITIPDSVTNIDGSAFADCSGLIEVTIGNGVTSIGNNAFGNCTNLGIVNWNAIACTNAGSSNNPIFNGCTNLTTVNIGDNVTTIPSYTFRDCSGLTSIIIPNSVISIRNNSFSRCSGLMNVTIGDSVANIGQDAFFGCVGLSSVNISNSVTSIGEDAFSACSGLTSITIGNGVTSIGDSAFYNCGSLTTVYWNATACASAGSWRYPVFSKCPKLTTVNIGNTVTTIPTYLFSNCSGLTSLIIPDSVTNIGQSAFDGCSNLKTVFYEGTEEQWEAISIGSSNSYLTSATRYYYSETEPALNSKGTGYNGNYWHYDTDGTTIVIWVYKTEEE